LAKSTFYFVVATLVLVDIIQGRYQRKLERQKLDQASASSRLSG